MMSGGPIAKFTEGWAVRLFGFGKAHYWKRDGVGFATPVCAGVAEVRVAALRAAGSFTRCKRCERLKRAAA